MSLWKGHAVVADFDVTCPRKPAEKLDHGLAWTANVVAVEKADARPQKMPSPIKEANILPACRWYEGIAWVAARGSLLDGRLDGIAMPLEVR